MQQRILFTVGLLLMVMAASSCGNTERNSLLKVSQAHIINGTEIPEKSSKKSSIVGVYDTKNRSICTGSLIANNIVLTAAHCVTKRTQDLKVIFSIDIDDAINIREQDTYQEQVKAVSAVQFGPTWDPKDETTEEDTGDIALIKFKGELPVGYKPATFLQDSSLLQVNQMVVLAGYGVSTVDLKSIDPKTYKKIDEAIEYGEVICSDDRKKNYGTCFEVETSGDGLLRITSAPISSLSKTEVRLNETKAGTCSGDSGGPAYIDIQGELYLFGITSRGSELCNEVGVYTNALYYLPWINSTISKM
ncbi:MAG: trypsin-like serine protease [Bacteriovoracaceae bacterium]|jgi:secreted trypsin-like serine protease|nr:trypsin-like serine protease [Bacteriovoracaceae bacterium]